MNLYLLFLPLFFGVYFGYFASKNEKLKTAFLDVIDSMPVILLPFLAVNKFVCVFVIGCIFANVLMRLSEFVGGSLYLLVYGFTGIVTMIALGFDLIKCLIAFGIIIALLIPAIVFLVKKPGLSIAVTVYALIALAPCVASFLMTYNIGYLALVIGDLTLVLYILNVVKSKWYLFFSNCIFYTGVILVPLTLQTLSL